MHERSLKHDLNDSHFPDDSVFVVVKGLEPWGAGWAKLMVNRATLSS
jgi:hypothetical protein